MLLGRVYIYACLCLHACVCVNVFPSKEMDLFIFKHFFLFGVAMFLSFQNKHDFARPNGARKFSRAQQRKPGSASLLLLLLLFTVQR